MELIAAYAAGFGGVVGKSVLGEERVGKKEKRTKRFGGG